MASSLTSDQVNFLIWRYLQESGFRDSARQFQIESKVDRNRDVFESGIKAGSLIYLIQRGLQYIECAALVNKGLRKKSAEPFCFFPATVSAVDVEDEGVGEENGHAPEDDDDPMEGSNSSTSTAQTTSSRKHGRDDATNGNGIAGHKRRKRVLPGPDGDTPMTDGFPETLVPAEELRVTKGYSVGTQVEDVVELTAADSILLGQEDRSVLTCAWNPVHSTVLVTASPDSVARIWNVPLDATPSSEIQHKIIPHEPLIQNKVISHDALNSKQGDVTALRWSPQGDLLATGSYDGQTRIWTTDGLLRFSHSLHSFPVTSLKWNKSANTLLSLSCDGKIIAWDALTGDLRRSYELVEETASDMDWVEDNQFVACGSKGGVFKYDLKNEGLPSKYLGHQGEVNCLTWDEVSDRLATGGGEDNNVLIWHNPTSITASSTTYESKLTGHTSAIVSLSWQPITTSSSPARRILASASNDRTIRIWDTLSGVVLHELKRHIDPIESISFSPDGLRLASSANGRVIVWRSDTGAVTHVYDGMKGRRKNGKVAAGEEGEISEISWDEGGVRVAVGGGELKCSVIRLNTKKLL